MKSIFNFLFISILITCGSCQNEPQKQTVNTATTDRKIKPKEEKVKIDESTDNKYSWLKTYDAHSMLLNQIATPANFKRTAVEKGSFGDWLRHLPLKRAGVNVFLHNGSLKSNQNAHHRVLEIDTGQRNLQQCADAIMRLRSEYFYSKENYDAIHFNFTSGDKVSFDDWRQGKRPIVRGNKVTFSSKTPKTDNSYSNFKNYLQQIFQYAGTSSLSKEMKKIPLQEIEIGDVFIQGGFPGHAVLVMDMAKNAEDEKIVLLAQSYMPAQDIHILKNYNDTDHSPWYSIKEMEIIDTPEWEFSKNDLKRF